MSESCGYLRWWNKKHFTSVIRRKTQIYHITKIREVGSNCWTANLDIQKEKKMLSKHKCYKSISLSSLVNGSTSVSWLKKKAREISLYLQWRMDFSIWMLFNNTMNTYVMVKDVWFSLPNMFCYSWYHLLIIFINKLVPSTIVIQT